MASGYNERGGADPDHPEYAEPTRHLPRRPAAATPALNAGRLWSGGVATAVVAALIGLVGLLVVRALLQIPYLAPAGAGALGDSRTIVLCMSAAIAALAATGLAHLLLVSTPRPMAYFGWIVGLLTAVAVVLPFLDSEPLTVRVATAIIHLVIGIAIGSLVTGAAVSATGGRAA
ncbi:DUF6069 family protein [Pseudonocardia sp. H11422]|uniref:DUF6069 family protein n=1 Tax=Pseudonocardia sp. H11422 TaxID=2835866 RepID=UPI00202810E9|nr:DUF6069 family protein [Pseudonocardia sp. H11422]